MKKNSINILNEINEFFDSPPSVNQKAWGIVNEFYHLVLTHMDKERISKADLAKRLGRSRSAISQMFNNTPNISVKKMVEIANSIGLEISIVPTKLKHEIVKKEKREYHILVVNLSDYRHKDFLDDEPFFKIGQGAEYLYSSCDANTSYMH